MDEVRSGGELALLVDVLFREYDFLKEERVFVLQHKELDGKWAKVSDFFVEVTEPSDPSLEAF